MYTLSSFVLFAELDTKDSRGSTFSLRTMADRARASHRRIAKFVRRDLFSRHRIESGCSKDFGCILPRPQLYFSNTEFPKPEDHNLAPAVVPKFNTRIDLSGFETTLPEADDDDNTEEGREGGEEEEEVATPPKESVQERRMRERRERRERERQEREALREERRREREAVRAAVREREDAEERAGEVKAKEAKPKAEPYKLSMRVQGELHNRARIEGLLETKVDVVMNQVNLEMRGGISCGGKPVMELKDVDAVLAAHPQLAEVIPEQDEIGSTKFGKCAVVGNSGNLLGKAHGEEIDGHDTVIRFNGAPTAKFEKDVGTKTTIRIQNVDNLGFKEAADRYLIFTARTRRDLTKFVNHRKRYRKGKQFTFNPEFWCHIWDWVSHRKLKPSTGLAGIVLALRTCDHPINLYGFSHNNTNFHYFNKLAEKVTTQDVYRYHPLLEEAEIYKELEAESLANLVS